MSNSKMVCNMAFAWKASHGLAAILYTDAWDNIETGQIAKLLISHISLEASVWAELSWNPFWKRIA